MLSSVDIANSAVLFAREKLQVEPIMIAAVPAHPFHDILGAITMVKHAHHALPHWMLYPAYVCAVLIIVGSIGSAVSRLR